MSELEQEGTRKIVQDAAGVHFEDVPQKEQTGTAYIEPEKAKTRRDLELELGKKRVAAAAELIKNRPPRIISEAERKAQGSNTPIFRPNSLYNDRVTGVNGNPVSQHVGALMRKVGGGPTPQS